MGGHEVRGRFSRGPCILHGETVLSSRRFLILLHQFYVYVARVCKPMIQKAPKALGGRTLGSRSHMFRSAMPGLTRRHWQLFF